MSSELVLLFTMSHQCLILCHASHSFWKEENISFNVSLAMIFNTWISVIWPNITDAHIQWLCFCNVQHHNHCMSNCKTMIKWNKSTWIQMQWMSQTKFNYQNQLLFRQYFTLHNIIYTHDHEFCNMPGMIFWEFFLHTSCRCHKKVL